MKKEYKHTNTTISMINYHFVFCPRYRRKIFKELVTIKCEELEIEILEIRCEKDHTYMFLNCLPTQSPSNIMKDIKGYTSKILREEFEILSKMPSLWTRNYFVSTAEMVSEDIIKGYIENQRTRY